ncbi:MAG: non-canonical purine pyrophosphatase [Rhodospirillales bacterium]|nr:non-canonical purine pyrophosphatase [Rhodospirillales bacterium]
MCAAAPRRRFTGTGLIVATHNAGKLREIVELLAPYGIHVSSAAEHGLPEPEETGTTFLANAELKALAAALAAGVPALSDDSGLAVDGLDGAPGIYSARWAGPAKDFGAAMARVERELDERGTTNRRAHFISALTLAWPDGHYESFEGRISGTLTFPPRGDRGFGYDPCFIPDGLNQTFGEMHEATKHRISHRARAFSQLVEACFAS